MFAALLLLSSLTGLPAAPTAQTNPEVDRIYQYFVPSDASKDRGNLGMYLWIPPNTPKIRAVMVAMHNGLPINILQSAPVRAVCRKHGIAQILITPWAKDIGGVMMKDLTFDVTDPARTAIYDAYIKKLADLSEHPELVAAPDRAARALGVLRLPVRGGDPQSRAVPLHHPDQGGAAGRVQLLQPRRESDAPQRGHGAAQRAHSVRHLRQPGNGELERVSARHWSRMDWAATGAITTTIPAPPMSRATTSSAVLGDDERPLRHVAAQLPVRRRLARRDRHGPPAGESRRPAEEPHAARRLAHEPENSRNG